MPKKSAPKSGRTKRPSAKPSAGRQPAKKRIATAGGSIPQVTLADVAKWCDVAPADVKAFASETGLPIGDTLDLAEFFRAVFALRDQLKAKSDASYTNDEGLICKTYDSAAKALKSRIGIGSAKSIQTWLALGMPGKPGQGVSREGYFPIDEMEEWCKANLSLSAKQLDEAAAERRRRKEEAEIAGIEARNAREAKKDAVIDGTLLPRAIYEAFVTELLATLSNGLMTLPLIMLRGGFVPKDRHSEFQTDSQKRIRNHLDELSSALERGPDKDR